MDLHTARGHRHTRRDDMHAAKHHPGGHWSSYVRHRNKKNCVPVWGRGAFKYYRDTKTKGKIIAKR